MQPFTSRLLAAMLMYFISLGVEAQVNKTKMNVDMNNPLLCDTVDGACEVPGMVESDSIVAQASKLKPIKIEYYTDPICSSCWGIEPQLRKLKLEYGDYFEIEYKMGGLLKDWTYNSGGISKPSDVAHHWDEVSKYYKMPIDGNVWLTDPLDSSYPPSIAFKAAQMQNEKLALVFLRKLREMVFIENKNITKWEFVQDAAYYAGLDTLKLKNDIANSAKTAFQNDLVDSRNSGVRGFPTLFFIDSSGNKNTVYGFRPYEQFENAILKAFPEAKKKIIQLSVAEIFHKYPTLTTQEFASISNITFNNAAIDLEKLYLSGTLNKIHINNGDLWIWKSIK